jgi:hypothetical protein
VLPSFTYLHQQAKCVTEEEEEEEEEAYSKQLLGGCSNKAFYFLSFRL